jgi:hypothetical protein
MLPYPRSAAVSSIDLISRAIQVSRTRVVGNGETGHDRSPVQPYRPGVKQVATPTRNQAGERSRVRGPMVLAARRQSPKIHLPWGGRGDDRRNLRKSGARPTIAPLLGGGRFFYGVQSSFGNAENCLFAEPRAFATASGEGRWPKPPSTPFACRDKRLQR